MLEHLRDLHLWNRLPPAVQILQQDALVQKGWACDRPLREAYFSSVPKPGAVVLVAARPDVIVERLRSRDRRINAHIDLSPSELHAATVNAAEAFDLASDIMTRRDVPVLEVDGEADLADAAEQVAGFLQDRMLQQEIN
jgi:thymidylate kinase